MNSMVPVISGPASIERLAEPGAAFGCRNAVVVADEAVVANGYAGRVVAAFDHLGSVRVHVVAPMEPTAVSVDAAASAVRAAGHPVVIGVGGGTALDTAKLAAVVAGGSAGVEHYTLAARPLPAGSPVVAIPTTSGTGSEVTRTCVLTSTAGRKVWVWGDELLPRLVVLDPEATATMPPHVTTATGLDALVHAVEAASGRRATPGLVEPAAQATRLVVEHLPTAVEQGGDLASRQAMQQAALLAGTAIDEGGTGIAHAIGHALGTLGHVPHGIAVAAGLASALAWNVAGAPDAFAPLAGALGEPVTRLPDLYGDLLRASGFADAVRRFGPLLLDAEELAAAMIAEENRPMYDNNCRRADDRDRMALAAATIRVWDEALAS